MLVPGIPCLKHVAACNCRPVVQVRPRPPALDQGWRVERLAWPVPFVPGSHGMAQLVGEQGGGMATAATHFGVPEERLASPGWGRKLAGLKSTTSTVSEKKPAT